MESRLPRTQELCGFDSHHPDYGLVAEMGDAPYSEFGVREDVLVQLQSGPPTALKA